MQKHEFVTELIKKMTIDEKIAQLSCVMPITVTYGQKVDKDKLKEIAPNGLGRMTQFANTFIGGARAIADAYNEIQRYMVEETRLGIPIIMQNESAAGLVASDATIFPMPIAIAATFDPELAKEMGDTVSAQAKSVGVRKCLAPVADVARDQRWGRVGETFGEDPTLVSAFSLAEVQGLQKDNYGENVVSCAKHFFGYGASECGNNCAAINLGSKKLKEVYGLPFATMIKGADLQAVMVTYSEINGLPMIVNKEYVNDYLKGELGFTGSAICDGTGIPWVHEYNGIGKDAEDIAIRAAKNGIDADTPMTSYYKLLKGAIESNKLDERVVDALVERVLNQKYELGLFDNPYVDPDKAEEIFADPKGKELSKKIASESVVLLKNQNNILPFIKKNQKIGVYGPFADTVKNIFGGYAFPAHLQNIFSAVYNYKNSMAGGFGDFYRNYMDLESMYKEFEIDESKSYETNMEDHLKRRYGFKTVVDELKRCLNDDEITTLKRNGLAYDDYLAGVNKHAQNQDVIVLCLGEVSGFGEDADAGEGINNPNLQIPRRQKQLIEECAKANKPMILVLFNGRGMELGDVEDKFDAILDVWYPGESAGETIAEVLNGHINPSGKLPVTFPRWSAQCPLYYGFNQGSGYHQISDTFFKGFNKTAGPLYPFGFGLSYSEFEYKDLQLIEKVSIGENISISLKVKNISDIAGTETVQLYFRTTNASVNRPFKELRAFKRVNLNASEEKQVTFTISSKALGYYDENEIFSLEPQNIMVFVGTNSEDEQLKGSFDLVGEKISLDKDREYLFKAEVK